MTEDKSNAAASKPTGTKVSEKSTKSEIWEAYNDLRKQIEGQPVQLMSPDVQQALVKDPTRSLAELKQKIAQQLDGISATVEDDLDGLAAVRRQIQLERRRLLEVQLVEQQQLERAMTEVKLKWQDERQQNELQDQQMWQERKKGRQREEDDYLYNLEKVHRSVEDKFQEQQAARESALSVRERAMRELEQQHEAMEAELAALPKRLDDAVAQTRTELGRELGLQRTTEIKELKLVHQHELAMANLKLAGVEQTVKSQAADIESLKRGLQDAHKQLKDMAIAVIEGRTDSHIPPPSAADRPHAA